MRIAKYALASVLLPLCLVGAASAPPREVAPEPFPDQYLDVFKGTNAYRAKQGKSPLEYLASLERSAQERADHLCKTGEWSHDGWAEVARRHTTYQQAAENLAQRYSQTDAVDAWIASPSHEKAMTGDYALVGFGYAACNGKDYLVAHYAK